jgi:putative metal-binding protein
VFSVRATDAAGNVEAAPPAASWLIAFDQDGDGFTRFSNPPDCNDSNASVHPGAPEARGGHVDTDCDGMIDPFLRIQATRHFGVDFSGGRTVVTDYAVTSVPTGDTVHLACAGRRRCPFRATSVQVKRGHGVDFTHLVHRHKLRAGVVLVIRITGPQSIGLYWSETIRKPLKLPIQHIRCMNPGSVKPQSVCPSFSP